MKNILTFRIWSDKRGVFMLNPQEIWIGDKNLNSITITKSNPNEIFTISEITKWKEVLQTIKVSE